MTSGGIDRDFLWPLFFSSSSWSWRWGSCPSAASFKVDCAVSAETNRATLRDCGGATGGEFDDPAAGTGRAGPPVAGDDPAFGIGAEGVTDGKNGRGGAGGDVAGLERGELGVGVGRLAGATGGGPPVGGLESGTCVNVSVLCGGDPTASLLDGSSGASFDTQNRPWQRGQLA
jgi:hypothetical protein